MGRYSDTMNKVATQGRHWGHVNHFLVQKVTLLNPVVREQCHQFFIFRVGQASADSLAEELTLPEISDLAPQLPQGAYLQALRFGEGGRPQLFDGNIFQEK